jgi:hypothetical protein
MIVEQMNLFIKKIIYIWANYCLNGLVNFLKIELTCI